MILPKVRDPRFVTVRRGGSLQDDDHRLLAAWAADCAQHVLHHVEQARPQDDRPRRAIDMGRAWARGEITMTEARAAAGHANAAARVLSGAARHAAYAAGQAGAVAHVAATNSVPPPMRSRQRGRRLPRANLTKLVAESASGSAPSSPARSGNSFSTTSDFATSCAGSPSIADRLLTRLWTATTRVEDRRGPRPRLRGRRRTDARRASAATTGQRARP